MPTKGNRWFVIRNSKEVNKTDETFEEFSVFHEQISGLIYQIKGVLAQ
jgi:hypothetical protein